MPDPRPPFNKYRLAVETFRRLRDNLLERLADDVVQYSEQYDLEAFVLHFQDWVEVPGTRLQLLNLLIAQYEDAANAHDRRIDSGRSAPAPRNREDEVPGGETELNP